MFMTVLGASPATQNPGGACSSYLIAQDGYTLVIDMGSGAFANLQRHVEPDAVSAIVISHMHADHSLDLIPYRYWLEFRQPNSAGKPPLYLPPGGHAKLLGLSRLQDDSPDFYTDLFDVKEYEPAESLHLGPYAIEFTLVRHAPHTYGMRVTGAGTLAYSADSGPCGELSHVARDADLFLCENANPSHEQFSFHLDPREAGAISREARVRRLVLTHRWHNFGFESARREAAEVFGGPINIAREGDTYAVGVDATE